jgi:hypothetical protein
MSKKITKKQQKKALEDKRDYLMMTIDDMQIELEDIDEQIKKLGNSKK